MQIEDYITECCTPEKPLLSDLYRHTWLTRTYPRMCCDHAQGRLLAMLSGLQRPRRALELGTFAGYSALCLAEGLTDDGILDTIEVDDEAAPDIQSWFDRSPLGPKIRLHVGDCLEVMPRIAPPGGWDLIFIDANKRQYPDYLEAALAHSHPGTLIIADNTLWGGKAADPEASDRQTVGVKEFNRLAASHPRLETVMTAMHRDGLTLMRVKG